MNPTLRDKSNKVTMKQRTTWLSNSNFLLKIKKKKITEALTIEHNCSGEDMYKQKNPSFWKASSFRNLLSLFRKIKTK